jgi:hypothetical protein
MIEVIEPIKESLDYMIEKYSEKTTLLRIANLEIERLKTSTDSHDNALRCLAEIQDLADTIVDAESADASVREIMYHSWLYRAKQIVGNGVHKF